MRMRFWIALALSPFLLGWRDYAPPWPQTGPLPDDPRFGPPLHYRPITSGTKRYRPVEPLPWEDLMRRMMPPGAKQPPEQKPPEEKQQ